MAAAGWRGSPHGVWARCADAVDHAHESVVDRLHNELADLILTVQNRSDGAGVTGAAGRGREEEGGIGPANS